METLKLRIKLGEYEFEGDGAKHTILEQFEIFKDLIKLMAVNGEEKTIHDNKEFRPPPLPSIHSQEPERHASNENEVERHLMKIFNRLPSPPLLTCSVLPPGKSKEADTALLLLLGFRFLENQKEVSVLNLNQSLRKSGLSPSRLDRMLSAHTRNQLVLKSGKGKGGGYQLTQKGALHAKELAINISNLLP